jgi:lipopolysaccharide transport system ATP-binding protein
MTPIIEIESISKKYYIARNPSHYRTLRESITSLAFLSPKLEFWALRDITFNLNAGDTMGVIGENGAGKTTLLKILSKITNPTSGKGRINGRVASLLEVGTGFHYELTGKENIYLNGVILGLKKKEIDKNFDKIVEFAGVRDFLNTPIKHYSSGMWARLAFSVAAHLEPEILLIDEVLSVGDTEFQKKSLAKMNDLSESGRTVIFVSHNMSAVRKLCKKCIYISEGKLKKIGDTDEVVEYYLSEHIKKGAGSADLTNFKPRKGSQVVKLKKIELRNQNDRLTGSFLIRDDLCIHLFFEASQRMKNVKIVVEIIDSTGETICNMYDSDSGFGLTDVVGNKHVSLVVKDIRFCPGRYSVSVSLISEILNFSLDYYDEIEYAISFDVENQIISDRPLTRRSGLLLLTPDWHLHNS